MIIESQACNQCGDIVQGRVGTALINKDHFYIKGLASYNTYDDQTHRFDITYLTRGHDNELIFCSLNCIQSYVEIRQRFIKDFRARNTEVTDKKEDDGYDW